MCSGASRTSNDSADTVNIVEPIPASTRSTIRCQYAPANARPAVVTATTARPVTNTGSSPNRPTTVPDSGANTSRDSANTLTTAEAAVMPTSKLRTNTGSTGATRPNPIAIRNDAPTRT